MRFSAPSKTALKSVTKLKKVPFSLPFSITNFSRYLKIFRTGVLTIGTFMYFLNPTSVAADFLKVTSPQVVYKETSFEINLEISAKANSVYSVKTRLGSQANQLDKSLTFNSDKNAWLSDKVAWTNFPQFKTDENGMWVGKINAKTNQEATLGTNLLIVRIRDEAGTITDSSTYSFQVEEQIQQIPPTTTPGPTPKNELTGEPILNEFVPQPSAGKEWVEIKNKGQGPIDLSGWWIDDEPGKSSPQEFPAGTILNSGNFYLMELKSAKLNDLSDAIRLLKPDQTEVESYRYDHTEKGSSWAKDKKGTWILSTNPSPNSENPEAKPIAATTPTPTKTTNKPAASSQEDPEASQEDTSVQNIPTVLGEKTKESTVSASFTKKSPKVNSFLSTPFFVLGTVFLSLSSLTLLKKKLRERALNT